MFDSLLFVIPFVSLAIWIYSFVFNHNIIQTYSNRLHIPKSQINSFIASKLVREHKVEISFVNSEGFLDADDSNNDFSVTNRKPSSTTNAFTTNYKIVGITFSATIALSVELIFLMLCELIDVFNEDTRLFFFTLTIDSLIFLLTVVQPYLIVSLFVNQKIFPGIKGNTTNLVKTVLLFIFWLVALHKCGDLSRSFTPRVVHSTTVHGSNTKSLIETKINEISIAGITILAVLSGIGSTSTPYKLFPVEKYFTKFFKRAKQHDSGTEIPKKRQITDVELNASIRYLNNTCSLLAKREQELERVLQENGGTIYNLPDRSSSDNLLKFHGNANGNLPSKKRPFGGLLHKVQSFASLASASSEESELSKEIEGLKDLRASLYNDLMKQIEQFLEQKHSGIENGHKIVNLLWKWGYMAFGLYCVYRIVNVLLIRIPLHVIYGAYAEDFEIHPTDTNVIDEQTPDAELLKATSTTKDALATTLAKLILLVFHNLAISETQLVNQLSFILSGSLFVCSFSNVLVTFKSFGRFLPASVVSHSSNNWSKHLIISELAGVYVIATALLIRTNLPTNLSNHISKILSLSGSAISNPNISVKEVQFIDSWFDKVFAFSCVATGISIIVRNHLDGDNAVFAPNEYDEESLLESSSFKTA
ncbi:Abscisic acid G-protein coupled receptor-domain-containing protein [Scheffersomyces xylosifermentans]|uniref:Abscisic acid G-protein coupled receptor-domain-containing protein n=1 Tax=Scheffersomyces xylosifermentans TaxID=1304137 RepID=UPI00315D2EF1